MTTFPHSRNTLLTSLRRKAHPRGFRSCHWMTTVFPPQGCIQRCNLLALWLEAPKHSHQMQLRPAFSTNHAMICPMGGFPAITHNELRDVTASLLSEVCHNVATEPRLQPLNGESLTHRTAITTDDACLDIRARGFWSAAQDAYFDTRVFHPNTPSNSSGPFLRPIRSMRTSRNGHMASVFEKSSVGSSHLLCFPPLVGWVRKPQHFTKG